MVAGFSNLKWLLVVSSVMLVAGPPAHAQATMKRGQAILFSTPAGDESLSNTPALEPRSPDLSGFANSVQIPKLNYNPAPDAEMPRPPVVSPSELQALQKQLDRQKNWALMTPAEIMGVPTLENIMNVPEQDANGEPKDQSLLERYMARQENQQTTTNGPSGYGFNSVNSGLKRTAPDGAQFGASRSFYPGGNPPAANPPLMDQFLQRSPWNGNASGPNGNSAWSKTFGPPTPAASTKPSQQQIAADEQFQKLLEVRSSPVARPPAPDLYASSPEKSSSPVLGQPAPNPLGTAFTPLSSGIVMPIGLRPLPALTANQNDTPALTPVAPEWKPKPPPWMSQAPQLGSVPQRKF